jgi:hypothetical protein
MPRRARKRRPPQDREREVARTQRRDVQRHRVAIEYGALARRLAIPDGELLVETPEAADTESKRAPPL